ncbi:hypothetical protein JXM67_03795 [candidate division WOR-3 bacterium]|nr:hypothetical protein [candidate division WOR-3 bacterium]
MSEKTRVRGLTGGIFAGCIVIWVGVSFLLRIQGIIPTWGLWWPILVIGLGVIFLLNGIAWLFFPYMRKGFIGMLIPSLVLAGVGIMGLLGAFQVWPVIIIVVGVVIIVSTVWGVLIAKKNNDE